ncbi:MAG: CC/Se motif family (seleno)protein [Syntrophothermus sp.]
MIRISPEAQEYIAKKGGSISLTLPTAPNCCVPAPLEPQVKVVHQGEAGKGIYADRRYLPQKADGVDIYVDTRIPDNVDLTVAVQGMLGKKWLVVEGWKMI